MPASKKEWIFVVIKTTCSFCDARQLFQLLYYMYIKVSSFRKRMRDVRSFDFCRKACSRLRKHIMLLLALLDVGETWPRLRYVFVLSEFVGNVASIRGNSLPNSFRDPWELDLPKLTTCWSIHFSFDKALGAQPISFVLSDDICLPRLEGDLLNLIYVFGNFGLQPEKW